MKSRPVIAGRGLPWGTRRERKAVTRQPVDPVRSEARDIHVPYSHDGYVWLRRQY